MYAVIQASLNVKIMDNRETVEVTKHNDLPIFEGNCTAYPFNSPINGLEKMSQV